MLIGSESKGPHSVIASSPLYGQHSFLARQYLLNAVARPRKKSSIEGGGMASCRLFKTT